MTAPYLGDYNEDAMVDFKWSTNDSDGASVTRSTDGTISVYKGNSATQTTTGVTDTEDFDSLTGIHHCRINTAAHAFYATGNDYSVVLSAATIDSQTVNAVLAHFSIENRYDALNTALPASPTTNSVFHYLQVIDALVGGVTNTDTTNEVGFHNRSNTEVRRITFGSADGSRTASTFS